MVQIDEKTVGLSRAKLASIFDAGTFVELGAYTKRPSSPTDFEGVVCGYGSVNGKLAFAFVQDSGRTKGAFGERHAKKIIALYDMAVKNGAPVIGVFDSAGAVVYDGVSALAAYGRVMKCVSDASGIIPQIAVIDGICGGSLAVVASMFDLTVTVKSVSELYVNPPFTVGKEAGTAEFSAKTGLSAYNADSREDAYAYVRQMITLLPQNNADGAYMETVDSMDRQIAIEADGVPAKTLVQTLCDEGSFLPVYEAYADNACLGFATFGGMTVGVVASEPAQGGVLDIRSARAIAKLVSLCDSLSLPVVTLVNSVGLDESLETEAAAYASELGRLAYAYTSSQNAKVTVVVGKAYGAAFTLLGSKAVGADLAYALPEACISVLSPEASVAFVWNDKVGEGSREDVEKEWKEKCASAAEAADAGEIDDVIETAALRQRICAGLNMLASKAEGRPSRRHANLPL